MFGQSLHLFEFENRFPSKKRVLIDALGFPFKLKILNCPESCLFWWKNFFEDKAFSVFIFQIFTAISSSKTKFPSDKANVYETKRRSYFKQFFLTLW